MTLVMMMTILHLHEHAFVDDDDDDHHQREHSGLAPLLLAVARLPANRGRDPPQFWDGECGDLAKLG